MDAVNRLTRFKEELKIRERKFELYRSGEEMFGFEQKEYPDLEKTKKDIHIASQLFDLYVEVVRTINEWKVKPWISICANLNEMSDLMESFSGRCKKLPGRLRNFDSYTQLKKEIDDFQLILPLLHELSKDCIKPRHWEEVMRVCNVSLDVVGNSEFKLESLLNANLAAFKDQIEEITDGADKQLKIEQQLNEIKQHWEDQEFLFQEWKERNVNILKSTSVIMEELEESQMNQIGRAHV
jgi:dynein heavy chain